MRVLLPPSETKRPDGGNAHFTGEQPTPCPGRVAETHARVREALIKLSGDADAAAKALKLGVKSRSEIAHNLRLDTAEFLPAIERYTGVLFDAIAADTLDDAAHGWLARHVCIQSALYGLIGARQQIAPYRLSATTRLPELGGTLKRVWGDTYADHDWGNRLTLDLRSKDYAALAPLPGDKHHIEVEVVARSADGTTRALNHFNKQAKGELVHDLAHSLGTLGDTPPSNVDELILWGSPLGWEFLRGSNPNRLQLVQRVR